MRKDFKEKEKMQRLLWCDRHCCVCEKACGINIEFAHIDQEGGNNIDNAIPVCYECHALISIYNEKHPVGNKFRHKELKSRREQIYDKYTRHVVAPIQYIISSDINPYVLNSGKREYPCATFNLINLSDYLHTKLIIKLKGKLNNKHIDLDLDEGRGHYTGKKIWNLNPRNSVNGNFEIKNKKLLSFKDNDFFEVIVSLTLVDIWDRHHTMLENGYVYDHKQDLWYFEP